MRFGGCGIERSPHRQGSMDISVDFDTTRRRVATILVKLKLWELDSI
jgi:hypothetical protein